MNTEMTTNNMSTEETIEILGGLVFGSFDRTTPKEREAITLAIKALEEVEDWHKLKLICANEGIAVYKIRGEEE